MKTRFLNENKIFEWNNWHYQKQNYRVNTKVAGQTNSKYWMNQQLLN